MNHELQNVLIHDMMKNYTVSQSESEYQYFSFQETGKQKSASVNFSCFRAKLNRKTKVIQFQED